MHTLVVVTLFSIVACAAGLRKVYALYKTFYFFFFCEPVWPSGKALGW